jgi:hypothetical protein
MTRFNRPSLTLITATVLATVMITAAAVVPIAGASPSRAARATINGHYRIVSTDCYFGSARCERVFDIGQISTTLADPHDKYLRGRVHGDRVRVGETFPLGTIEDSWVATGTTTDGGQTVSGTMSDGIGGTGNFVMVFERP